MAYVYQADCWCDDCGEEIIEQIKKKAKDLGERIHKDDSDKFPHHYLAEYDEADSPKHCASGGECLNAEVFNLGDTDYRVGQFLENPLTTDGIEYVKDEHKNNKNELTQFWMDFYNIKEEFDILLELEGLREQIQQDLLCVLDGFNSEVRDKVCQVVVDRVNEVLDKLED